MGNNNADATMLSLALQLDPENDKAKQLMGRIHPEPVPPS